MPVLSKISQTFLLKNFQMSGMWFPWHPKGILSNMGNEVLLGYENCWQMICYIMHSDSNITNSFFQPYTELKVMIQSAQSILALLEKNPLIKTLNNSNVRMSNYIYQQLASMNYFYTPPCMLHLFGPYTLYSLNCDIFLVITLSCFCVH